MNLIHIHVYCATLMSNRVNLKFLHLLSRLGILLLESILKLPIFARARMSSHLQGAAGFGFDPTTLKQALSCGNHIEDRPRLVRVFCTGSRQEV